MTQFNTGESNEAAGQQPPNFVGLLDVMLGQPAADPELTRRLLAVREFTAALDERDGPFLSVLVRTQGHRIEPFKDALLCLAAQSDQDFEVIVLSHNTEPESSATLREIIARQPEGFRARIVMIDVEGGTRARPLNVGLQAAHGRYIAVYDDDDLIFANWVEEFRRAATNGEGRLLRAIVANQEVIPEIWPSGVQGFRTSSWPKAEYAQTFDQLKHLLVNHSPFMSWAFPATLFTRFGLRFDEELEVCEDWDIILRGSLICGVDQIDVLTSVYRRWKGGTSSYTSHSTVSWQRSERRVIERIDRAVFMVPPGTMRQIRDLIVFNEALVNYRFLFKGNDLRLPLKVVWRSAAPLMRLAVRVRNKIRRIRASRQAAAS